MGQISSQANRLDILVEMRGESRQLLCKRAGRPQRLKPYSPDVDAGRSTRNNRTRYQIVSSIFALKQMDNKQREYYQQGIVYDDDVVGRWIDHELLIAVSILFA